MSAALDPRDAESNAFQDAVLGMAAVSRALDALVAELPPGDGPAPGTPPDPRLVHVLLGLLSLRKTFGLALGALAGDQAGADAAGQQSTAAVSAWSREHLR